MVCMGGICTSGRDAGKGLASVAVLFSISRSDGSAALWLQWMWESLKRADLSQHEALHSWHRVSASRGKAFSRRQSSGSSSRVTWENLQMHMWKSLVRALFLSKTVFYTPVKVSSGAKHVGKPFVTAFFYSSLERSHRRSPECRECGKAFVHAFMFPGVIGSTLGNMPFKLKEFGEPFVTTLC